MESQTNSQLSSLPMNAATPAIVSPVAFGRDEAQRLLEQLAEPFDPSLVEWVVTATAPGKNGQRGLLAAYADPRAYLDRLNQLFTPCGWTQDYSFQVVGNVERRGRDGKGFVCAKVMVCCRITIFGIGTHSGTGEHWADDENAVTGGDAQAFKRACVCFGLGRYLYDVPQAWVDLDEFKRPRWLPDLPESALPKAVRRDRAGSVGTSPESGHNGSGAVRNSNSSNGHGNASAAGNGRNEALKRIQALSTRVGRNIFRSIVVDVAGVDNPGQVGDVGKLKAMVKRLENADRGIQRLKAAVAKVGLEAHRALCHELNLPSALTDDIPDTKVLRQLVERLEQEGSAVTGPKSGSQAAASNKAAQDNASGRNGAASASEFAGLRNNVLTLARRLASGSKRPIADVIAWASDGTFQYADIGKLTPADGSKLQGAVRRLQEAVNEPLNRNERR
jgi:hypothetical protein